MNFNFIKNFFRKKRNIILHSHIFKNAGTTFDHSLENNFNDKFIDHRDDEKIVKDKQDYLVDYLNQNKYIKAFSSHSIHFNAVNNDEFNFHQIYFLRHPIERIKSVYTFELKQPTEVSLGAKMAKELDLNEYIRWRMRDDVAATIRNCHTIFISGQGSSPNFLDEKFKIALSNIKRMPLIGVVDRYDESMVMFEDYLQKFFPTIDLSYVKKNVTNKDTKISTDEKSNIFLETLDEDLQKLVLEKNAYDLELYKIVNEMLNEKIFKIDNFDKKLENFKQRCLKLEDSE